MRLFFAIFFPPLAVLMCGKPGSALLNIILCVCGVIPGMIHAVMVVNGCAAEERNNRLIRSLRQ